ncbi:hypothetical protein QR685DRAFT_519143 [Neurospora intermedia]|uniref:Uncharacterized protein n=1 Tax=Neurospora intermedia TaxID=5142 RepID=A0ABR3DFF8_NEUIN
MIQHLQLPYLPDNPARLPMDPEGSTKALPSLGGLQCTQCNQLTQLAQLIPTYLPTYLPGKGQLHGMGLYMTDLVIFFSFLFFCLLGSIIQGTYTLYLWAGILAFICFCCCLFVVSM